MTEQVNYGEESVLRLHIRQAIAYIVLIILTFACLFPFYILIVYLCERGNTFRCTVNS